MDIPLEDKAGLYTRYYNPFIFETVFSFYEKTS